MGTAIDDQEMPRLPLREALEDSPPPAWEADIDQAWFRGSFAMDEIVFSIVLPPPSSSPT